ncbi:MAG: hypothetical protein D6752_07345 [Candidatus Nitrosothermus koennekii]|nr:MAG: hypothetical protein D6752_07345 [Candidatus Nitrosothermus koennekii]
MLLARGANKIDFINDVRVRFPDGWSLNFRSDVYTFTCSRRLLEDVILEEVRKHKNIKILDGRKVEGLLADNDRIMGVKLNDKSIYGDLIVDASGRNTNTPRWLEELGFGKVRVSRINSYVGYVTKIIQLDEEPECKSIIIFPKPPDNPRMGVLLKIEDQKWMVGALGINKNYPPTDNDGFLNYLKMLEDDSIYKFVKDSKPVSKPYSYREIGSKRYHYEEINMPKNLLIIGDAGTSLNPLYGQGMTIAALTSLALRKYDMKEIVKVSNFPWLLGTSEDFRWSATEGEKPIITKFIQWLVHYLMLLSTEDKEIAYRFARVIQMLDTPTSLLKPRILFKILYKSIISLLS